jgi:hypothetical protein
MRALGRAIGGWACTYLDNSRPGLLVEGSAASRSSNNHVVVVAVEVHSSSLHSIYQDQDLDLSFMLSCSRRGSSLEIIDNMIPLELVKCGMCGKVSTIS